MITHNPVTLDEVVASLSTELPMGIVNFKFEPFVLHILCANLEAASNLVTSLLNKAVVMVTIYMDMAAQARNSFRLQKLRDWC